MVEPFAGTLLNSLRPTCLSLKQSSASLGRVLNTPGRPTLAPNFFNPAPRDVKGKGKAREGCVTNVSDCRKWACCASRHSIWCSESTRSLMLDELEERRMRCSPQSGSQSARVGRHQMRNPIRREGNGNQRRRVSSRSVGRAALAEPSTSSVLRHAIPPNVGGSMSSIPPPESSDAVPGQPLLDSCLSLQAFLDGLELKRVNGLDVKHFDNLESEEAFEQLLEQRAFSYLDPSQLLDFVSMALYRLEWVLVNDPNPIMALKWGDRIYRLLRLPNAESLNPHIQASLMCRALAMRDKREEAQGLLSTIPEHEEVYLFAAFSIALSFNCHMHVIDALEFALITNRHLLSSFEGTIGFRLQRMVFAHPYDVGILDQAKDWSETDFVRLSEFLLSAAVRIKEFPRAMTVLRAIRSRNIPISDETLLDCSRRMISYDDEKNAEKLLSYVSNKDSPQYLRIALGHAARMGEIDRVDSFFEVLQARGWVDYVSINNRLYAYGKHKRLRDLRRIFDEHFPLDNSGKRLNNPTLAQYVVVMQAHSTANGGDIEGVNSWLLDMRTNDLEPDEWIYVIIAQTFAVRGDLKSLSVTLQQMEGMSDDARRVAYISFIKVLGSRKDYRSAKAIFQRACKEGIIPDKMMITSIMSAYAEAGYWDGVKRIYEQVTSTSQRLHLSPEIYSVVFKALIYLGTPYKVINNLFLAIQDAGVEPTPRLYSQLVQSACDARRIITAMAILYRLLSLPKHERERLLSPALFTILMEALLKAGDTQRAKVVFHRMLAEGFEPTAVTYHTIVKSYSNSARGNREAHEVVRTLFAQQERGWDRTAPGKKSPLVMFYSPMLRWSVRRGRVGEAERIYEEYTKAGGSPSITMLALMLFLYRVKPSRSKFLGVWDQLLEVASPMHLSLSPGTKTPTRDIQAPLSLYIDFMSRLGRHKQVVETWKSLSEQGLLFDAQNWNHYAVAHLRAGNVQAAFEILEFIILPRQAMSNSGSRVIKQTRAYESSFDPVLRSPIRHSQRRRTASPRLHVRIKESKSRLFGKKHLYISPSFEKVFKAMRVARQRWSIWRPHTATANMLLWTLIQLQRGFVLKRVASLWKRLSSNKHTSAAQEILAELESTCPETVEYILKLQRELKRKLSQNAYRKKYVWRTK